MAFEASQNPHEARALSAVRTAPGRGPQPVRIPDTVYGNAPATVFREIAAVLAATLAFVAAVDLALIALGIR